MSMISSDLLSVVPKIVPTIRLSFTHLVQSESSDSRWADPSIEVTEAWRAATQEGYRFDYHRRFKMRRGEMRGRGEGDRNLRRANTEPTCSPPVLKLRMREHVGKKVGGEEKDILSSSTRVRRSH